MSLPVPTFATLSPAAASAAAHSPSNSSPGRPPSPPSFDLGSSAPADAIKPVAVYLEQLTVSNDAVTKGDLTRFHARTVPTIDILAYLQRILKYAPCGNEVFLAVLVYFDRMSRRANALLDSQVLLEDGQPAGDESPRPAPRGGLMSPNSPSVALTRGLNQFQPFGGTERHPMEGVEPPSLHSSAMGYPDPLGKTDLHHPSEELEFTMSKKRKKKVLIINSYNVHRLLITGVMVASKLFSDVFFLNSHYAKVGGLPVMELNQLELEFLIFNDFNLHITIEELQKTGDALLARTSIPNSLREAPPTPERGMLLREIPVYTDGGRYFPNLRRPRDGDRDDGMGGAGFGGSSSGNGTGNGTGQQSTTPARTQTQPVSGGQRLADGRQAALHQISPPYDFDGTTREEHTGISQHPRIATSGSTVQAAPGGYPPSPASIEKEQVLKHYPGLDSISRRSSADSVVGDGATPMEGVIELQKEGQAAAAAL